MRESTGRDLEAYVEILENATVFKYLGRVMMAVDYDWPAVVGNLCKARERELGSVVADIRLGGGGSTGVRTYFLSSDAGGVVVLGGDVGDKLQDRAGPR